MGRMWVKTREAIARKHGFANYAELAAIAHPLPPAPGDKFWSYVARGRDGLWFAWEDRSPDNETGNKKRGESAD